jgi:hypothetical protein
MTRVSSTGEAAPRCAAFLLIRFLLRKLVVAIAAGKLRPDPEVSAKNGARREPYLRALTVDLHQSQRLGEHRNTRSLLVGAATTFLLRLVATCGPGDEGEPVETVMLPEED